MTKMALELERSGFIRIVGHYPKGLSEVTSETMQAQQVQQILDSLLPNQSFQVSFLTNKGEQRVYSGKLLASGNASESIAFETSEGIKRFNIHNVVEIKGV